MYRKVVAPVLAVLIASTVALTALVPDADYSGKYAGTITIPSGKREKSAFHASFTQQGAELTGTVGGSPDQQVAFSKGRVESTKFGTLITFDIPVQNVFMHFELRPFQNTLRGVAKLDGERATAPVELQLVK